MILHKTDRHVILLPAESTPVKDTFSCRNMEFLLSRYFFIKKLYINHINDVKDVLIQLRLISQRHVL